MNFEEFFKQATGYAPFPYQVAMATSPTWPSLVSVPTGLGKTAAALLGWQWRRRFGASTARQQTPRRLVYCLPMRVLVEQTHKCAVEWLRSISLLGGEISIDGAYDPWSGPDDPSKIRVHMLMGGDVDRDWDRYPEREAILIGTQDMLLSRVLNRGYAMSRFRWPVQFGLLNNDCLWIMDEVQLMGSGLATTTQVQAFRRKLGAVLAVKSTWMSATMRPDWLATVDFDIETDAAGRLEIGAEDTRHEILRPRFEASKRLSRADFDAATSGAKEGTKEAELALARHHAGSLTLIVVNTVKRAQAIFECLRKKKAKATLALVHSRFRPADRRTNLERLLAPPGPDGTIGVCTQVIEAGVDVSSRLLITDLAPWSSLVQRFGRCNRKGEFNQDGTAEVVWIPPTNLDNPEKLNASPYTADELVAAAKLLATLADVGPAKLPPFDQSLAVGHVIRRKDLVDLFDTTPDLAGADIDVSRFIRETDDHDVQVFWRTVDAGACPDLETAGPSRSELCTVTVGDLRTWFGKHRGVWRFDHLTQQWRTPDTIYPGLVLMLRAAEGGYCPEVGWDGKAKSTEPIAATAAKPESNARDPLTERSEWATIAQHTDAVVSILERLLGSLSLANQPWRDEMMLAARWHDVGKVHAVFQAAMPPDKPGSGPWAKSKGEMSRYERPGFRHELASGLALLLAGKPDLSAYLSAAHHGKVRLSIRSLPNEAIPKQSADARFARGVWDGDQLPTVDLGGGAQAPDTTLDLSFMELGDGPHGPSWLARMLALRDAPTMGPFRLAFLEALLRVADWRASNPEVSL